MRLRRRSAGLDHSSRAGDVAASTAEAVAGIGRHPDTRAAAFFDLDNTVLRGASLFYLARGMHARGFLRTGDIARFGYRQLRFALGAEDHQHIDQARAAALSLIAGRSVAELFEVARSPSTSGWRTRSGRAPRPSPGCTSTKAIGCGS